MSDDRRIEQFEQMAKADPDNELGHFSLGKAYLEAGRYEDACGSLARVLEINADLSKAYQTLGDAYEKSGQRAKAVEVMTRGVGVADRLGDRMPRDAMAKMLGEFGEPVPSFQQAETTDSTGDGASTAAPGFKCSRCGSPAGPLEKRPFKGALGEKVLANVCAACWKEWIPMGTKVINELGLVLSSQAGSDSYDQYMVEFLQLEDR